MVDVSVWNQCYNSGWQGLCVPEAFAHPAKFSRALIQRIYQHALAEGWLVPGDTAIDPFGGVSLGAFDAALVGVRHVSVELEPKFHQLAQANVELWQRRYGHLPQWVRPVCLQGDSRTLGQVLAQHGVDASVSSPPYNLPMSQDHNGSKGGLRGTTPSEAGAFVKYGMTPGQLEGMPPGSVTAVISSPPYATGLGKEHTYADPAKRDKDGHRRIMTEKGIVDPYYGSDPAQLGNMAPGVVDAVVSSPPYGAETVHNVGQDGTTVRRKAGTKTPWGTTANGHFQTEAYGTHPAQLGHPHGDTFWAAARTILEQVFAVLRPGGHAIWVVKSYCRDGHIVDFPGQWRALCASVGFVTLHEHHAVLVEHHGTQGDLLGDESAHVTSKKSFFRRLYEKSHPENAINFEVVLCMVKPASVTTAKQEGVDACIASPPYADSWHDAGTTTASATVAMRNAGYSDAYIVQQFRASKGPGRNFNAQSYGRSPGQLGAMPAGTVDAVISSPPFTDTDTKPTRLGRGKGTRRTGDGAGRNKGDYHYGDTVGQLGAMPPGTAPPREEVPHVDL